MCIERRQTWFVLRRFRIIVRIKFVIVELIIVEIRSGIPRRLLLLGNIVVKFWIRLGGFCSGISSSSSGSGCGRFCFPTIGPAIDAGRRQHVGVVFADAALNLTAQSSFAEIAAADAVGKLPYVCGDLLGIPSAADVVANDRVKQITAISPGRQRTGADDHFNFVERIRQSVTVTVEDGLEQPLPSAPACASPRKTRTSPSG